MANNCPFCGQTMSIAQQNVPDYFIMASYNCPNCGSFKILNETYINPDIINHSKRHLFSGYIREMNDFGRKLELITNDNLESILSSPLIPKTIMDKLDKLLLFIFRKTEQLNQEIDIDENMPSIAYAKNSDELEQMLTTLVERGFLAHELISGNRGYSLTLEGYERAEELQKEVVNSTQCFIAMWFSPEMLTVCETQIKRAIVDSGYHPLIVSDIEHNDKICDQIIAEIRKSKFLIADYTGNRGGVYFEAGFAYGLGLPVIWTCRKDHMENLHFDVNHYNFIVWETGEDLYEKLKNRIQATIL